MNQRALADIVGIDVTYLSKIENGRMAPPSAEAIRRMAEALAGPDDPALEDELLVLAKRVPEDVERIVTESAARPAFFRSIADLSDSELGELSQKAEDIRNRRDA
jgi:transcriptional regulator with XRE-family HTH domain